MKKRELQKEKNYYKELNNLMDKLDSYEEIYPGVEIEEILMISEKNKSLLKVISDFFSETDISLYINRLLQIEEDIHQYVMLSEEDIKMALYIRDELYLMSSFNVCFENKLQNNELIKFYKKKQKSIKNALIQNNNLLFLADANKVKSRLLREIKKIQIYEDLIKELLNRLENSDG